MSLSPPTAQPPAGQAPAKPYDYVFKLLLVGDSSVGKTCLLLRFCDNAFSTTFISTIGIDFKIKTITLDNKTVKLQIWDTAGQERFRTITTAYYRGAMGIVLVYDITSLASFHSVRDWMKVIDANAAPDVIRVLVGNKCDMGAKRQVPREQGMALAEECHVDFLETSAKTAENVESAFMACARAIKAKFDRKINELNRVSSQPSGPSPSAGPNPGIIQPKSDDEKNTKNSGGGCAC